MLLSLDWLREFVPYEGNAEELGHALTMLGLELEEIRRPYDALSPLVVGHVVECYKHPEADKLSICRVDAGQGELLDIVCGAPNVAQGQKVPVALVGTVMPDGMLIKKAKLRGAPSHGMICSERELGLAEDHAGIMVLDDSAIVGTRLLDALTLDREILDVSVTPNRADCLSVLGLAREVALAFNLPLTYQGATLNERLTKQQALKTALTSEQSYIPVEHNSVSCLSEVAVEIANPELCWLYQGYVIENVRIGPSPMHIRHRLHAHGMRPINNIVDATNCILLQFGQPLHAFDRNTIRGNKIAVQTAGQLLRDKPKAFDTKLITEQATNEINFVTLDGKDRTLVDDDLCICDGEGVIALAGIMGGGNSEITETSTSVFLESAVFHPASIRKTARRLGLSSASSYRFERGVDQANNRFFLEEAVKLMIQLSDGQVCGDIYRNEPRPWQAPVMRLRPARANSLLGVDLDADTSKDILHRLGCTVDTANPHDWQVTAPSWRCDLEREVDLIEELGRVHGLDSIAPVLPPVLRTVDNVAAPGSVYTFWSRIKRWGKGLGLNEAVNYSFVGHKDLDALSLPKEGRLSILNPLSADQDALRTALTPGLLHNLRHNMAQGNTGLRLFELAHIFTADANSKTTAREQGRLGLLLCGDRVDGAWPHPHANADYHDIKAVIEHLCAFLRLPAPRCVAQDAHHYLMPAVDIQVNGQSVGFMGRLLPALADACHTRKDVWLAELDLDILYALHHVVHLRFTPLPVLPPVRRDITVIAGPSVTVDSILDHVRGLARKLLEDIRMIDLFTPETTDGRHLTFRLTFRADRTLNDAEVDKERELVAQSLREHLDVRI